MAKKSTEKRFGARVETVDLSSHFNFPRRLPKDSPLGDLLTVVKAYPFGEQQIRGIPVAMGPKRGPRIVLVEADKSPFAIDVGGNADYICVLHWNYSLNRERMSTWRFMTLSSRSTPRIWVLSGQSRRRPTRLIETSRKP